MDTTQPTIGKERLGDAGNRIELQGAITNKICDKLFNQMRESPEDLSADLRQALLQALKVPKIREKVESMGTFTPEQTEEILAGLKRGPKKDPDIGTYAGSQYFLSDGFTVDRGYLHDLAEQAYTNRNSFPYDESARWLYERYKNRAF